MTNNHDPLHSPHPPQPQQSIPIAIKKRKASDAGVGPSTGAGSHPLGGNSGFGYQAVSSTTPLQPPKLKAIKKRKIKETSASTTSGHPEATSTRTSTSKPTHRERSTREFTPTDEELSEVNDHDNDDDDEDDDEDGEGRGQVTGHKLSEAYRRLQSRRGESKEGSEAEGGGSQQGGGKKSKRNRVHFSCVEVSLGRGHPLGGAAGSCRWWWSCPLMIILFNGVILVWVVSSVSLPTKNVYLGRLVTSTDHLRHTPIYSRCQFVDVNKR